MKWPSVSIFQIGLAALALVITILFVMGLQAYPGQKYVYVLFSFAFNYLLWLGMRRDRFFFDSFLGAFLWIGFWVKLTVRHIWYEGYFTEPVGYFDQSPELLDKGALISACGAFAFCLASLVRQKWICRSLPRDGHPLKPKWHEFYSRNRKAIRIGFIVFALVIAFLNLRLGIYQRGTESATKLLPGMKGIFTWLILFGLASGSALMLEFEVRTKGNLLFVLGLSFIESFASSVSMLSRAFILNASALMLGLSERTRNMVIPRRNLKVFISLVAFFALFILSFKVVSSIRVMWLMKSHNLAHNISEDSYNAGQRRIKSEVLRSMETNNKRLFIDRWVGIEGVLSIVSYPHLGWDLWRAGWNETYSDSGTSFYDLEVVNSDYDKAYAGSHFITLQGLIGFFYYPGSAVFLFVSLFLIGLFCAGIEIITFKLTGSIIFCSLIGQVVAYRLAHFGYVPKQSYLLLAAIFLNILIFAIIKKITDQPVNLQPKAPE